MATVEEMSQSQEMGDSLTNQEQPMLNDTQEPELIPTSLHLTGVDELSTKQIKEYIDLHIKPGYSYATRKKYAYLTYEIQWINDSELNINFNYNNDRNRDKNRKHKSMKMKTDELNRIQNGNKTVDLFDEINQGNNANENNNEFEDISSLPPHQQQLDAEGDIDIDENKDDLTLQMEKENEEFQKLLLSESIKGANESMFLLTDIDMIRKEHPEFAELSIEDQINKIEEAPKSEERKCWDLILDNKTGKIIKSQEAKDFYRLFNYSMNAKDSEFEIVKEEPTPDLPEDYKIMNLTLRFSLTTDKKVQNAKSLSRYYLIHGEPDALERGKPSVQNKEIRDVADSYNSKDLITGESIETHGMFGYEGDRNLSEIKHRHPDFEDYSDTHDDPASKLLPWGIPGPKRGRSNNRGRGARGRFIDYNRNRNDRFSDNRRGNGHRVGKQYNNSNRSNHQNRNNRRPRDGEDYRERNMRNQEDLFPNFDRR